MKTFYLLDGHAQVFRAYYAPFRPLTSPSGEPVKAVHVFTQLLLNILHKERPDYFAIAFDVADATTERRADYEAYKAQREEAPDDLGPQFQRVFEVVAALGIPVFMVAGHEADDVIATIAERLAADGAEVDLRIASKDKDLHQILTPTVRLWDPSTAALLGPDDLWEQKGYTPAQSVEIQTLVGDPTDNVPGIRGVGVKTAAKLIEKYGSADAVIAHADEQTPKLRENLLAGADGLALTRRLVTLKRDVEFEFDLEACATPKVTKADVRELFEVLGFRGLLDTIPDDASAPEPHRPAAPVATTYRHVATEADLAELVAALEGVAAFAIDTETTGLSVVDADLVGYALSWAAGTGWYVPVRSHAGPTLDPELVREALRPFLEDEGIRKVGHHLKFDLSVLEREGITLRGPIFDTLIAAALLNPERRGNSMDDLARDLLRHTTIPISDLIGKGKNQTSMLDVPLDVLSTYAAEDADVTWRLFEVLEPQLAATDADLVRLFEDVELPLVRVLAAMERAGVTIDVARLAEYRTELAGRIETLRAHVLEAAGCDFNVDSPKQLSEVLFGRLGFRVVKKTKTGASTDAEVLDTLAAETRHPLPERVMEYRELTKLLGTYVDPLPSYVSPTTGRLHASFHQTGAATGRLSSSDPNIQNIPIRSDAGREIRRAFVARDADHLLLSADYSQVELRVLAHFSEDPALLEAFRADRDIHAFVASQIYAVSIDDVTSGQRAVAKTVNFGIVYGQTAYGLARTLRIEPGDAQAFITTYKATYAGLDRFLQRCVEEAREHGYVKTILGRRRPIPQVASRNFNERALGERLAINTVIQGSAADLIKLAMVRLHARLEREGTGARMLIQVHDELVLETPKAHADAALRAVVEEMQGAIALRVPLKVDASLGPNWLEGKG
ncbi:MAG: DNA polymerase I [Trueperaceae bacterium]